MKVVLGFMSIYLRDNFLAQLAMPAMLTSALQAPTAQICKSVADTQTQEYIWASKIN